MAKPAVPAAPAPAEAEPVSPGTIAQTDETRAMFADCEDGDLKWVQMRIDSHDDATITFTPLVVEYEAEKPEAEPAGATPKAIKMVAKAGY